MTDRAVAWGSLATAVLVLLMAVSCGSADLPESASPTTSTSTTLSPAQLEAELDPTCVAAAAVEPGATVQLVASGGVERSYLQYVPLSYEGVAMPVVINLHDAGGTASAQDEVSALRQAADADGFVLLTPQGLGDPADWGTGTRSADVTFIADMLDQAAGAFCLEPSRVFAVGLGSGGAFAGRLACDLSDRIAAVAGVEDVGAPLDCNGQIRPVPMLGMFSASGPSDPTIPGAGFDQWAEHYGCDPLPTALDLAAVEQVQLSGCDEDAFVAYYVLSAAEAVAGVSSWPSPATTGVADLLWPFFVDHPLTLEP